MKRTASKNSFPMIGTFLRKTSNDWKFLAVLMLLASSGLVTAAPEFSLLGTNGAEIVSGDAASGGNGTDFGVLAYNTAVTNVFAITNSGDAVLLISGCQIKGYNSATFSLANLPASVDAGAVSNVSVAFSPSNWAPFEARIEIANNTTNTPFVLNLKGDSDKTPFLSTNSATVASGTSFLFNVSGFDPLDNTVGISWSNVPPWMATVSTGGLYNIEWLAGTNAGFSGDGWLAASAQLNGPTDVLGDGRGGFYIADNGNNRVRYVDTNRFIWTVAGGGTNTGSGIIATNALMYAATGIARGPDGSVYIAAHNNVRRLDTNGLLWIVAGHATNVGFSGDGGPATNALCEFVLDVAVASDGTLYFVQGSLGTDGRLRKVDTNGIISTVLWSANLYQCYSIEVDREDRLYYSTLTPPRGVFRVDPTGGTVLVAGGRDSPIGYPTWATNAWLVNPFGIAMDRRQRMWIGESGGGAIESAGLLWIVYTNGILDRRIGLDADAIAYRALSSEHQSDRLYIASAFSNKIFAQTYQQRGFVLSGTPTNFVGTTNFLVTLTNEYTNITISFTMTVYPALSLGSPSAFEGDSGTTQLVVTAQLNALATSAVTFAFATSNGTAQAGVDYVSTNGTVTIPYGTNRATFAITVFGDTIQEPNESINLHISNVSAALAATNLVQAWILNDDTPSLSINDVTQYEGNSGLSNFVFTVSIQKPVTNFVSFAFTNVDFSTLAGSDYVATGGVRTIAAGQTSVTVVAQVVGDTNLEPDEVFYVQLRDIQNAIPQKTNGTATILDDDQPRLHINTITNFEGNSGTSNFTFTVTKSYNDGFATLFYFKTSNGTATAGSDYMATNGSGFLLAGQLTTTIVVRVNGDTNVEPDEFFYVIITNAAGALPGSNGVGWIRNDDFPSISVNNIAYEEGHSGASNFVFTMTLSEPAPATGSVTFITANGTAASPTDYTATSGVINISVGQTSATAVVRVTGDRTIESDETFFLQLRNPINLQPGNTNGQGTILNDDYWPQISVSGVQGYEGNSGASNFNFRVWLDVVYTGTVQFGFTTVDGTATAAGGDYQATNGTAAIPPGSTQTFVTVLVNGDTQLEPQESFSFRIGDFVEAFPVTTNATGTILPDDGPFISATPVSVYEGNSGTTIMQIPIVLSQVSTGAVTFDYYTVNGSATTPADYYFTNVAATIPAGSLSVTATVTVVGDTTTENDETFILAISNVVGATFQSVSSWSMTVVNDDGNQVFITGTSRYEGNSGTSNFTFVISRTNTASGAFFNYRSADATAKAGSDYTAVNSGVLMNPGVSAATVTVQVAGDLLYEGDETFYVQLMGLSGSGSWCANTNALMTILEDGDTLYFHITTPNQTTMLASVNVSGAATGLVGELTWSNLLTQAAGRQAVSDPWTINGVGLALGANPIVVSGTNASSVRLADTVTVTRIPPQYTLTVVSAHGSPVPSGVTTNAENAVITNRVASPVTANGTQYYCVGWTMAGNDPAAGSTNILVMTVTNDAALTWSWKAQDAIPPTVGPVTLIRATNQVLKAPKVQLMTNSFNLGGGPLTVSWVSNLSSNGYPVSTQGVWVIYRPATSDNRTDFFNFRVRNIFGLEAEGVCEVIIPPAVDDGLPTKNISDIYADGGNMNVRFVGIPDRPYDVQGATILSPANWSNIGHIVIGPLGYSVFVETNPPPTRYYRTAVPTP